jgi:ribonuclease P protein component
MKSSLPAIARIRNKKDFNAVFKNGKRFRGEYIDAVVANSDNDLNTPRIGISIPARVGKAVTRNRMRRLVREAFRLSRSRIQKNVDIVIIVKQGTPKTPLRDIESDFNTMLSSARLL